jgi:hypothetical protein
MKKVFYGCMMVFLALSFFGWGIDAGYAQAPLPTQEESSPGVTQNPTPPANPSASVEKNSFTFSELGYKEKLMVGPYSSISIYFSVPANWELIPGGNLSLKYTHTVSGANSSTFIDGPGRIHGSLLVQLNNKTIKTFFLDKIGENTIDIPLSDLESLTSLEPNGEHNLRLILDASISCDYGDVQTTLLINPSSSISLQHQSITPIVDLSVFPRPIYQPNSIIRPQALAVIPDNPTTVELQAAMTVLAGLGAQTDGEIVISIRNAGDFSESDKSANNVILIGPAQRLRVLEGLRLPIPVSGGSFTVPAQSVDDGIIQMAVSPWNNTKTLVVVSGNSDEAVLKAARTLSTGRIISSGQQNLSLIAAVNAEKKGFPFVQDQTFAELGYPTQSIGQLGENYFPINFYISPDQAATTEAYIDLVTSHSNLLNFSGTAISVYLNDEIISSERFDEESGQINQYHIKILPNLLRPGENQIEIYTNLVPYYNCYSIDLASTWLTISDTSVIHIPAATGDETKISYNKTLRDYPELFFADPTLQDLALVIAKDDPAAIEAASRIAFYLGAISRSSFINLTLLYADEVPDEILKNHNLMLIGRASTLPILSELNDQLPAPFDMKTDQANQDVMLVNYSLPEGVNVGYLQFITSPWNPDKIVMTVTGNTQTGIPMAANALVTESLVGQLNGNYAIIFNTQVLTTNTKLGLSSSSLAGGIPSAITATPTPSQASPLMTEIKGQPSWLLPAFFGTSGLLILSLLGIALKGIFKSKSKVETLPSKLPEKNDTDNQ